MNPVPTFGEGHEITIRPYADSDLAGVIAVLRDLQASECLLFDRMLDPATLGADYVHAVRAETEKTRGCLLVAVLDGLVIGYCTLHLHCDTSDELDEEYFEYSYVGDLGVLATARSKGIGASLLEECERRAKSAGLKWLRLSVLASNGRARKFYSTQGFGENLILLEKPL